MLMSLLKTEKYLVRLRQDLNSKKQIYETEKKNILYIDSSVDPVLRVVLNIPLRNISEKLRCDVNWNAASKYAKEKIYV